MNINSKIEEYLSTNAEIRETEDRLDYYIDNTSELADGLVNLFAIHSVSQQSELLFAFFMWFRENGEKYMNESIEKMIQIYLKSKL